MIIQDLTPRVYLGDRRQEKQVPDSHGRMHGFCVGCVHRVSPVLTHRCQPVGIAEAQTDFLNNPYLGAANANFKPELKKF